MRTPSEFRKRRRNVARICSTHGIASVVVAGGLVAAGCAGSFAQSRPTVDKNATSYESPRFYVPTPIGAVSITVTAGAAPALPESAGTEWLTLFLSSAALAPLGLIAPPLYASTLIVGGGMIATGSAAGYAAERTTSNTVARAVRRSDLAAALTETLRARAMPAGDHHVAAHATVAVAGWGVVGESGKPTDMHCLVAGVELSISREGKDVLNDQLKLTLSDPSANAPPLQCARLAKFAEEDGRLVRETVRDYAELFALMITDRLDRLY